MTHSTLKTFGYPNTLIHEYDNWAVLLRPHQATLGSIVIIHKSDATALSQIDTVSFTELDHIIKDCESTLSNIFDYQKINYLMLMMNDPHVHYHVIPRYDSSRMFDELAFEDTGWPALPDLAGGHKLDDKVMQNLLKVLKEDWTSSENDMACSEVI